MIVSAAVRIYDKKQDKVIFLPVHRHCDAFYILKELGYTKDDFICKQADQGFLDEHDNFYNRVEAKHLAIACGQIKETDYSELFSEDLY